MNKAMILLLVLLGTSCIGITSTAIAANVKLADSSRVVNGAVEATVLAIDGAGEVRKGAGGNGEQ
ncbi:MAG: hypothetical protein P1U74_04605 [Legionellaceae bacterium]|nr:hypothetical protein [Legionellaceae bacterium]